MRASVFLFGRQQNLLNFFWILFAFFNVSDADADAGGGRWRSRSKCSSSSDTFHVFSVSSDQAGKKRVTIVHLMPPKLRLHAFGLVVTNTNVIVYFLLPSDFVSSFLMSLYHSQRREHDPQRDVRAQKRKIYRFVPLVQNFTEN